MKSSETINRYIYAVTKRLPRRMQKDVSEELLTLVGDMLDARCGEISPTDHDVRVVLTELARHVLFRHSTAQPASVS